MTKEERIKNLIDDIRDASAGIESPLEIEMDYFEYEEGDYCDRMTGWYAWEYDEESREAYPIDDLPVPLITQKEIEKYHINIYEVFNRIGCYYCG